MYLNENIRLLRSKTKKKKQEKKRYSHIKHTHVKIDKNLIIQELNKLHSLP